MRLKKKMWGWNKLNLSSKPETKDRPGETFIPTN